MAHVHVMPAPSSLPVGRQPVPAVGGLSLHLRRLLFHRALYACTRTTVSVADSPLRRVCS